MEFELTCQSSAEDGVYHTEIARKFRPSLEMEHSAQFLDFDDVETPTHAVLLNSLMLRIVCNYLNQIWYEIYCLITFPSLLISLLKLFFPLVYLFPALRQSYLLQSCHIVVNIALYKQVIYNNII